MDFSRHESWSGLSFRVGLKSWAPVEVHGNPRCDLINHYFRPAQSLSHIRLFATPWTAARQASLSVTNSQGSLKLMSTESVMPSNHLILCRPLLLSSVFPTIRVFPMSQFFESGGQSTGVSASASVLPVNIQDTPLGWTGWISLQSTGFSSLSSNSFFLPVGGSVCRSGLLAPLHSPERKMPPCRMDSIFSS